VEKYMTIEQCTEMMRTMGGMMGRMIWPIWLGILLFWTLVIIGIVLLVRLLWLRIGGGEMDALRILQERFARGEINREEYEEPRSVLQGR
jgi:putative membrane protein